LKKNFSVKDSQLNLIPSGVNTTEFSLSSEPVLKIKNHLSLLNPQLERLNLEIPIFLFVGAFERKGLPSVLKSLEGKLRDRSIQLIIIGKPEEGSSFQLPEIDSLFHIHFTKEVKLFYEMADCFIFPTKYEPFGLVIIEAYAMGLDIFVTKEQVGATEILTLDDGLFIIQPDTPSHLILSNYEPKKITREVKELRIKKRLETLKNYTWKNAGQKFQSMLVKN
jgi:glycosyltransferase involved in cell wall biosynthesis